MAKGIEKIVAKFCVETAIYWGNPQNDGFGGFTFDDPVEIPCRWENKTEINLGWFSAGYPANNYISKASVLVTQDLDLNGFLWLGKLDDFDSDVDLSSPLSIKNAYVILRFDKIPMVFKTDEFVRTAWLYEQGK